MQSAYNQMLALSCLISERRWLRISRLTQHVKRCHGDGIECEMINYDGKRNSRIHGQRTVAVLELMVANTWCCSQERQISIVQRGVWVWIEVWLSVTAFSSFFHTCQRHTLAQKGAGMARTSPAPFINHCQLCHSDLHSQRHVIY